MRKIFITLLVSILAAIPCFAGDDFEITGNICENDYILFEIPDGFEFTIYDLPTAKSFISTMSFLKEIPTGYCILNVTLNKFEYVNHDFNSIAGRHNFESVMDELYVDVKNINGIQYVSYTNVNDYGLYKIIQAMMPNDTQLIIYIRMDGFDAVVLNQIEDMLYSIKYKSIGL